MTNTYVVKAKVTFDVELMVECESFAQVKSEILAGHFDEQHFNEANDISWGGLKVVDVTDIDLVEEFEY